VSDSWSVGVGQVREASGSTERGEGRRLWGSGDDGIKQ